MPPWSRLKKAFGPRKGPQSERSAVVNVASDQSSAQPPSTDIPEEDANERRQPTSRPSSHADPASPSPELPAVVTSVPPVNNEIESLFCRNTNRTEVRAVDRDLSKSLNDLDEHSRLLASKLGIELVAFEKVESAWKMAKGGEITDSARKFANTLTNFQESKISDGLSEDTRKTVNRVYYMTAILLKVASFGAEVRNKESLTVSLTIL